MHYTTLYQTALSGFVDQNLICNLAKDRWRRFSSTVTLLFGAIDETNGEPYGGPLCLLRDVIITGSYSRVALDHFK